MKAGAWTLAIVVVLLGGGVAGVFLASPNQMSEDLPFRISGLEEARRSDAQTIAELQRRIEELSFELSAFEGRFRGPSASTPSAASTTPPSVEVSSPQRAPASLSPRSPVPVPEFASGEVAPTPQFRSLVRVVIAEKEAEDAQKARQEALQRLIDRVNRRVDEVSPKLSLSDYQKEQLRVVLLKEEESRFQTMGRIRDAETPEERQGLGLAMRDIRATRNQELGLILTPQQLEQFQGFDRNRFGPGGGFGGAGFGGGFGDFGAPSQKAPPSPQKSGN